MRKDRVVVRSALPRWREAIHAAAKEGIVAGAEVGVERSAAAAPVGDGREGVLQDSHLRDTYDVIPPAMSKRGYSGGYGSNDPNSLWQELGTIGRRTRKARRAKNEIRRKFYRQEKSGRTVGVKAKRIMSRAAKPALAGVLAGMRAAAARRFL